MSLTMVFFDFLGMGEMTAINSYGVAVRIGRAVSTFFSIKKEESGPVDSFS